ncbi:MAG: LCP family protein [Chloroflexota bacterium]
MTFDNSPSESLSETQQSKTPNEDMSRYQPITVDAKTKRKRFSGCGCLLVFPAIVALSLAVYFLAPSQTNLLILGIDRAPEGTALGRSDTIILAGVQPSSATVNILSIPRDLWVVIPERGEQRINTAHFFAEAEQVGSGPAAAIETIEHNFGLPIDYYMRLQLENFPLVIDALGGIDIVLDQPTTGLPAGPHHFSGEQALAFVRSREGTDDFFRMAQGQMLLVALFKQVLRPSTWGYFPAFFDSLSLLIDTDLPAWGWPRFSVALLRSGPEGLNIQTLGRDMLTPFTTNQGAQVLLPNWELILPFAQEMFGTK